MTNLLLLNDAHDDEKLPSCETSTSTRVVESPEDEISSHDPSATGQVRSPGVIDRQIESCENDSVGKEYTPPIPTWKLFTIVFGLCLGLFMALMDMSIISTALYTISVDFNNYRLTIWAALAYILADIGCAVFFTRLADVFGRKQILLTSFIFFTIFSLACGFSQTVEQLIIFRTLQGIGGTGLYSLAMVICPEISPPKYLHHVVSAIGATVAISGVMGPVLGGIITGTTTWRWIFWLNVPIGTVAIIVLYFIWPGNANVTDVVDIPSWKRLDFLGAFLSAVGSIGFVYCVEQVGTKEYSWSDPLVIGLVTLSSVSVASFFGWEYFVSRHAKISSWILPQLPMRIVLHRPMGLAILSTILIGYVQFTAIFSIPLRAQIVDLNTPVKAGLRLLPLVASTAVGSLIGGGSSAKKNLTFHTMSIGTIFVILGSGLLSSLPADGHPVTAQYGYEVLLGIGLGMAISTATFMNSLEVEFEDHAVSQGTVAQCRILGGAVGIAVSTVVMNNHIKTALTGLLDPQALSDLYISPFNIIDYGLEVEIAFRESYIEAFAQDLRIGMYVACAALICAFCSWQKKPPTVAERSAALEVAVREYQDLKKEREVSRQRLEDGSGT